MISYDKIDPFKALVFVSPVTGEEDEEIDQINILKEELKFNMTKIRNDFNNGQQRMVEGFAANQNMILQLNTKFNKFQDQVTIMWDSLKE